MEAFLKKYEGQIQGVFIHNDDMAIGAIEAIKAAGLNPGDLKIVSVDGTRGGFQAMIDGWLQADVECNPLLGPQVMDMALKLMNGEPFKEETLTNETYTIPIKPPNYCQAASTKSSCMITAYKRIIVRTEAAFQTPLLSRK